MRPLVVASAVAALAACHAVIVELPGPHARVGPVPPAPRALLRSRAINAGASEAATDSATSATTHRLAVEAGLWAGDLEDASSLRDGEASRTLESKIQAKVN